MQYIYHIYQTIFTMFYSEFYKIVSFVSYHGLGSFTFKNCGMLKFKRLLTICTLYFLLEKMMTFHSTWNLWFFYIEIFFFKCMYKRSWLIYMFLINVFRKHIFQAIVSSDMSNDRISSRPPLRADIYAFEYLCKCILDELVRRLQLVFLQIIDKGSLKSRLMDHIDRIK